MVADGPTGKRTNVPGVHVTANAAAVMQPPLGALNSLVGHGTVVAVVVVAVTVAVGAAVEAVGEAEDGAAEVGGKVPPAQAPHSTGQVAGSVATGLRKLQRFAEQNAASVQVLRWRPAPGPPSVPGSLGPPPSTGEGGGRL